jgi:hypothetical protein
MTCKVNLTVKRITNLHCPSDRQQAFLWDRTTPGLGLRATPKGKPSFIFQGRYQGKTLRLTIGNSQSWSIPQAQTKAREFQRLIDEGKDPRQVKLQLHKQSQLESEQAALNQVTFGDVFQDYINARKAKVDAKVYVVKPSWTKLALI